MKKHKNEHTKRIFAMICAMLVALAFLASIIVPISYAATQTELDRAKDKKEDAKGELDKAKNEYEDIVNQYNALDQQISDIEHEVTTLEKQILQTKNDILVCEEEIKKAEQEYQEYQEVFKVRARVMYENTEVDYLEILFGAEDFGDFLSKIEMVSQIVAYDNSVLTNIANAKKAIELTRQNLKDTLTRQEENVVALEGKKQGLDAALSEKQKLMTEAEQNVEKYKAIYEAAEKAEEALIRNNRAAFGYSANPVKYTGGKFAWPVPSTSRITSSYGYRIHPVYKTKKFHSGIDIGAPYGVDIVAAADGTVTLATTNGGYGKCVIINHGSGITTLYGHNSQLLVSKGDRVSKGQVIAKAGSTGVSTGPHLHYEVRINGSTTDPMSYYN